MTLRQARILSSETDNTIKQEQTTNVNIKVQQQKPTQNVSDPYPSVTPGYAGISPQASFSSPITPMGFTTPATASTMDALASTSAVATGNPPQVTSVLQSDLALANAKAAEFEAKAIHAERQLGDLTIRNEFLELLLEMYQSNPLKINSYVIADNKLFMRMVKLLCGAEKAELVLDDDLSCGGCCGSDDKLIYVSKILVTIDGKTEDLKYCRNDVYSQFTKYGISTKIVSQ